MSILKKYYNQPQMEILTGLLRNVFFWVFVVGAVGGFIMLRVANHFRDRAAFADFPDRPEKFLLRARIFYGLFAVFLLTLIAGLGVVVFQVLQVVRPALVPETPTAVTLVTATPSETTLPATPTIRSITATPVPTFTPEPTATSSSAGDLLPGVIGNTNFQGVNCRETASLSGQILAKLVNGTSVLIVNGSVVDSEGYTWQQVQLEDGRLGWIVADFLIPATPAP